MPRPDSTLASLTFVVVVAGGGLLSGHSTFAVYALAYWHYYLYWLAFRFGAVPLPVFRRDAILMKAVALGALGFAYLAASPDPLSLAVIAAGFSLNAVAARALGMDRTYYGYEVAGLAPSRVTAFPYSVTAHPMLLGNVVAFAGTLLNAGFRRSWWPLALGHVTLNLGLLIMEVTVTPQRRREGTPATEHSHRAAWLAGATAGVALAGWAAVARHGDASLAWLAAGATACICAYAWALFDGYSRPFLPPGGTADNPGPEGGA